MTATQFRSTLKALGLTQRSFASPERLGVDVHTVNRWATGALPVPRYAAYALELLLDRKAAIERQNAGMRI